MRIIISIILLSFCIGYLFDDYQAMIALLLILFVSQIVYSIRNLDRNITLLVFLIAFFTFLMGRVILPLFVDTSELIDIFGEADFSKETQIHICVSLFISLVFVWLGFCIGIKKVNKYPSCRIKHDGKVITRVRFISKQILYFTFVFSLVLSLEKVLFVLNNGYYALYLDYNSKLPYIVTLVAHCFEYAVMLFLATLPTKKESIIPILLYLILGISSIGTGQRSDFVLTILMIITYLFLRNTLDNNESKWIGRKGLWIIGISLPLLVLLLFLIAFLRMDVDVETSSNFLLTFMYQQGVSVDVIGYGYDYYEQFPPNRLYLLGDIIDYYRHNFIAQFLFDAKPVEPQSVERALNDFSYDATLTYLVKPHLYLRGGGLGSCYIAEAWHDLGYIGVAFVNYVFGFILGRIPYWCRQNVWISSVALLMFINIVYAPRSRTIKFVYVFFSLVVILFYIFVYIYSKRKKGYEYKVTL
ncbi:MAG: O-antigen polysaccharide polymerase Wzy family protein [Alphaproteobacteria bacterium]|nr:O-antigen polysaccharide polymerase Wzy family protein [Alphaproteobacteria bacterium]